jgi:nucleoside-diphosphate-sugar epimerase
MTSRVVVTGGLGFVGSRLCEVLLEGGHAVRCVDNLSALYASGTGGAAAAALAARGAEVVVEDVAPVHLRGADAVIHLAALPGVRTRRPASELHEVNVALPARLARAASRARMRFVLVSSSSVYGDAEVLPTPEDAPCMPLNPYAESKLAAERAVLGCGGDALIVRPFTVYGPGQRPEMAFARWIEAAAEGRPLPWHAAPGTARDFTFVDDAAAGLVAALNRGRSGEAYNVSGGRSVELREALAVIGAALGAPAVEELAPAAGEARVTSGCGRKAATELGYAPRVDLRSGLERQLAAATPARLVA